jgi:glycosyltransferase involved in cell wall biosynthesis
MPKISVIIPLYNKENYILNTLKSVLNQTFKDFEIIIIDDGSTDASVQKISIYKDKFTLLRQKNQGVSVARNLGIENSKSDLIAFLDADDVWEVNHLEELYHLTIKFSQASMYCSRYTIIYNKNLITKAFYNYLSDNYEGYIHDFFYSSMKNRVAIPSCVLIKKVVFDEVGNFNETLNNGEDLELWIKIALKKKVGMTNKYTVKYFLNTKINLSKIPIAQKRIPNFDQFCVEEQSNSSLKKFLDVYRLEYGLNLKRISKTVEANKLFGQIDYKNLSVKSKILIFLPSLILKILFYCKQILKRNGIDLSIN